MSIDVLTSWTAFEPSEAIAWSGGSQPAPKYEHTVGLSARPSQPKSGAPGVLGPPCGASTTASACGAWEGAAARACARPLVPSGESSGIWPCPRDAVGRACGSDETSTDETGAAALAVARCAEKPGSAADGSPAAPPAPAKTTAADAARPAVSAIAPQSVLRRPSLRSTVPPSGIG